MDEQQQSLLDLASPGLPLTERQRDVLTQEVDWHGALHGAFLFPILDNSISDDELMREVARCRERNPGASRRCRPWDRAAWSAKAP